MNTREIVIEQQKKVIFTISIIAIIGIIVNFLGITGHQGTIFMIAGMAYFIAVVVSLILVLATKNPPVQIIISLLLQGAAFILCVESVLCAYENTSLSVLTIVANMTVLSMVLLMSLLAYLNYTSYIIAGMTIISYTICVYITDNKDMWGLYILFVLLFASASLLGTMLARGINNIFQENIKAKVDMQNTLTSIGLTEAEFMAHITLAGGDKMGDKKTLDILKMMGDGAREKLKKNVTYLVEQDKIAYDKINEFIPEFSSSEAEIAKLIIEGKKISDIIRILDKKASNITCQRSNMRVKLKLNDKDNLRDEIIKRIISK